MEKDTLIMIEKKTAPLIAEAEKIEAIETAKDMAVAAEVLSKLNKYLDKATEEKEKVTVPLKQALKAEQGRWKGLEGAFEGAISVLKRKMIYYQTEEKRRADGEAARIEARVGEGRGKLKVETAVRQLEEVDKPAEKIVADNGMVKFKTVKRFEIMDITLVPWEYLVVNESKVREAMKEGIELGGVRYYEEQVPVNYR